MRDYGFSLARTVKYRSEKTHILAYFTQCFKGKKFLCFNANALREIEKGISNEEVAIKYGVPENAISTWVKNTEKYFKALETVPDVREIDVALDWKFYVAFLFSITKEDRECRIGLVQEFQNLLSLDKIDRLKQSLNLNFLRKETKYFLMLKFIRHLVPSCRY